jgi:hypothetical protein
MPSDENILSFLNRAGSSCLKHEDKWIVEVPTVDWFTLKRLSNERLGEFDTLPDAVMVIYEWFKKQIPIG